MKFSAKRIAEYLNGEIIGNPDVVVDSFSKIEEGKEGSLSFLANPKYTPYLYKTNATIVIVDKDYPDTDKIKPTLIKVSNAYQAFASLLKLYSIPPKGEKRTKSKMPRFLKELDPEEVKFGVTDSL
jgi:UDP-3-O-[3-hydroxymyristoyl] glucosamine N-acyltransferase